MNKKIRIRTWFLGGVFTFLFFLLAFRLFWIQTVSAEWLKRDAQTQWERNETIQPKRGTIYDRNGEVLAYTAKAYTVIAKLKPWDKADKLFVENAFDTAQKLSPILGMPTEQIARLIENGREAGRTQVELRPGGWKVNEDTAQKIADLKVPGIFLYEEKKRYYPNDSFLSHILGYVDLDGKPVMGIEKIFDEELSGEKGEYKLLKDRKGFKLPDGIETFKPAKDGDDIYLTIDYQIQNYVEDALNNITKEFNTKGISVLVADPNTGDILALANRPHFNPNSYQNISNWTNYAISSTFEPGSTFKIVTLAAAIEEGVYSNDETYHSGTYRKVTPPINDHNGGKGWGTISFLRGVQESSNVLFAILGYDRLGKDKFYDYLEKFGFGQMTGIGLPGEVAASLKPKGLLYPRDVASMTFGQGVAVTAIQQVAAVSAVANGGELLKPHIVKEIRASQTGEVLQRTEKETVRRVVSEKTSKMVRDILETVVTDGTGRYYNIPGYHVAGKTGTAQVAAVDGGYKANKYIYSFIGFAPKDKPELLVSVVVDQPDVPDANFGGRDVVSPIFKHVMQNSLQYLKISPDLKVDNVKIAKPESIQVPDLLGKTPSVAVELLGKAGLQGKIFGDGTSVIQQYPDSAAALSKDSVVYLITSEHREAPLPDFSGKTLREVMEFCTIMGLQVNVLGEGFVTGQSIPPGTIITKGEKLTITLHTKSVVAEKTEEESDLQETVE